MTDRHMGPNLAVIRDALEASQDDPETWCRISPIEASIIRKSYASSEGEIKLIRVLTSELLELVEAFVAETVDYATINKLGDPEKQHNVKWARKVIDKAKAPTSQA